MVAEQRNFARVAFKVLEVAPFSGTGLHVEKELGLAEIAEAAPAQGPEIPPFQARILYMLIGKDVRVHHVDIRRHLQIAAFAKDRIIYDLQELEVGLESALQTIQDVFPVLGGLLKCAFDVVLFIRRNLNDFQRRIGLYDIKTLFLLDVVGFLEMFDHSDVVNPLVA